MQAKFSRSLSLEDTLFLQNRYENVESVPVKSSRLEERIEKYLESQNVFMADPLEKVQAYFRKQKFFIFQKQESISQASLTSVSLENLPTCTTLGTLGEGGISKRPSMESQEMVLKGVESFKLLKKRRKEDKLTEGEEEKKT